MATREALVALNRELGLVSGTALYQAASRQNRQNNVDFNARQLRTLALEVARASDTRALYTKVQARGAVSRLSPGYWQIDLVIMPLGKQKENSGSGAWVAGIDGSSRCRLCLLSHRTTLCKPYFERSRLSLQSFRLSS